MVAGLRSTASERRLGKSLLHSSIPCAHSLYVTPWSSSCHLIELDRRCWRLVLKCYESRTRQHKMLNVKALRPSGHYFPSVIMNLGRRL
jgi:hypothetical protein